MKVVGIKVLKNKLSEYLRLVSQGETILVSDREQVVAELVPPQSRSVKVSDALLAEAVREGLVTPALYPFPSKSHRLASMTMEEMLDELSEDRSR